ncbi:5584_t:CDS:2, partial [Gigaspora margarita]
MLKTLTPSIPTQNHWNMLRKRLFATIGYTNNESASSRTHPGYKIKSQKFKIQLRKSNFLNSNEEDRPFESLSSYNKLSEKMKAFSIIAQARYIKYIKEKLNSKKPLVSHPISIAINKEQMQSEECSINKEKLIIVIESLI